MWNKNTELMSNRQKNEKKHKLKIDLAKKNHFATLEKPHEGADMSRIYTSCGSGRFGSSHAAIAFIVWISYYTRGRTSTASLRHQAAEIVRTFQIVLLSCGRSHSIAIYWIIDNNQCNFWILKNEYILLMQFRIGCDARRDGGIIIKAHCCPPVGTDIGYCHPFAASSINALFSAVRYFLFAAVAFIIFISSRRNCRCRRKYKCCLNQQIT